MSPPEEQSAVDDRTGLALNEWLELEEQRRANGYAEAAIQRDKLEPQYSNEYETALDGRMLRG